MTGAHHTSVEVIVAVEVIGPVIVAVHLHGNDTMIVIRPVYGSCATAQSTPQNTAEGTGKTTRADEAKHYTIARGSAMECAAHASGRNANRGAD
jgi:hypothetical protein